MGLSSELIDQLVKVTQNTEPRDKDNTAYGTVVVMGSKKYVKIDGSDLMTPVSSTVAVENGDRVIVTIKNHSATVTGNTTSPAASDKKVTELGTKISDFEIVIADKVSAKELDVQIGRIDDLTADNATIKETLTANKASIDDLTAKNAEITGILEANKAKIDDLDAKKLDADIADIKYASVDRLDATDANLRNLKSDYAQFEKTTTGELQATNAKIDGLDTKYANVDFSNIGKAAIERFYATSGIIKDLVVGDQTITGELVGITITGDLIKGNTIVADKLVVKGSDGLYYKLNTDGVTTEKEQTEYNSLNGQIIQAKSITATKIDVKDLVAFGATIGGFNIGQNSIFSGVKESVDNNSRGIYMDENGQIAIGDVNNYIKYFKDTDGKYRLKISADSLEFNASGDGGEESKDLETVIKDINKKVDGIAETNKGIGSITNYYLATSASSDVTTETAGWTTKIQNVSSSKKYLWNYEVTKYTDDTVANTTEPCIIGMYSAVGATGNGIQKITEYYALSALKDSVPTVWSENVPNLTATNKYLWNYEEILYTNGGAELTKKRVIGVYGDTGKDGAKGEKGDTGPSGKSIGSVINYYLATASSSGVKTSTSGWTITVQNVTLEKKYLWNYEVVKYSDGTVASTTSPCIIGTYGDTGKTGATGAQGYSIVTNITRDNRTEAEWEKYSAIGYVTDLSNTQDQRNGCRIGDIFTVTGTATDTKNGHVAYYRSDTASGQLHGSCISHTVIPRGESGKNALQVLKQWNGTYTTIGQEVNCPIDRFNRTPVTGDMFTNVDASSNLGTWQITKVADGQAYFKMVSYVSAKGATGATGNGIKSIKEHYAVSTSNTVTPTSWFDDVPVTNPVNKYLWNYETITYTNGTSVDSNKRVIGVYGDTGKDGAKGEKGDDFNWNLVKGSSMTNGTLLVRDRTDWMNSVNSGVHEKDGFHMITPSTGNSNNGIGFGYNDFSTLGIKPGDTLTFSCDVKGTSDANKPFIMLHFQASGTTWYDSGHLESSAGQFTPTADFKRVSVTYTLPDKDVYKSKKMWLAIHGNYASDLYIRNIKLELGSPATPWAPHPDDLIGETGSQGYSLVAHVIREGFTESQWSNYGTIGHVENWVDTETKRNGCRIGDIFAVVGTATDTKNGHIAYYRSDTASGQLHGTCISHTVTPRGATGAKGETGATGPKGETGAKGAPGKDANQVVHTVAGNGNTNEYIEFATIKVIQNYANYVTTFKISGREYETTDVQFSFVSGNTTDPGLYFLRATGGFNVWMYKKTTSTWGLVTKLNEAWGYMRVYNFQPGNDSISITWTDTRYASLPTGCIAADQLQAAKTATNFMEFTSGTGLQIGDKTNGTWKGFRSRITSTAFEILNEAGTAVASYGRKLIQLGKDTTDAVIELCGGKGIIKYENVWLYGGEDDTLTISAENMAILSDKNIVIRAKRVTADNIRITNQLFMSDTNIHLTMYEMNADLPDEADDCIAGIDIDKKSGINLETLGVTDRALTGVSINGRSLLNHIYPVGSIYMSTNATNPSNFFGGTWVAWGAGRVPVGFNSGDANFNSSEKTGGSKTINIQHNHGLSNARAAVGRADSSLATMSYTSGGNPHNVYFDREFSYYGGISGGSKHATDTSLIYGNTNNGGPTAASVLQPYITCYMWKRTA